MDKIQCETIVFDFNGTIVDDVDICWNMLNRLLTKCGHPTVTKETYLSIFTFPIIEYYRRAGFVFPKDDFDELAIDFDKTYNAKFKTLHTFPDVKEVLNYFSNKRLVLLSASKQTNLYRQLNLLGLEGVFNDIVGIQDIYATSKLESGKRFFEKNPMDMEKVVFVGDTLHDNEVALALGGKSILIARGHQNTKVLSQAKNALILPTLEDLKTILR